MKARIKELAEQAGLSHMPSNYPDIADLYKGADFELEKFAKLIVSECVEQVWYTREDGINGNVSQVIKDRIKEHFGVE